MNGLANIIVCLWFLPVILYAIIPLTMLCGSLVCRLIATQKSRQRITEKQGDRIAGANIFVKTAV